MQLKTPPRPSNWLEKVRLDCPACENLIHLNNAGASLPPLQVTKAQVDYLEEEAQIGGYEMAARKLDQLEAFYDKLALLFGGQAKQYAWHTSATDAYNRALSSIPFQEGDALLTTRNDYSSNHIAFLQLKEKYSLRLVVVKDQPNGIIDLQDFENKLREYDPRLVAVTYVPSHAGVVQPVVEIGRICSNFDCWYMVDGCQAIGQIEMDLPSIGCDFFAATFRKFLRGPRGAGFLYVSDRALESGLEPLFLDMFSSEWPEPGTYRPRSDARRFELWERSHALVAAASACLDYLTELGQSQVADRVLSHSIWLQEQFREWPDAQLVYPDARLHGIITVYFQGQDPKAVLLGLRSLGVHTSISWGDYAQFSMMEQGIPWAIRFSPHYFNKKEKLESAIETLKSLLAQR